MAPTTVNVTEKINELSRNIRKKYLALKLGKAENDATLDKIFRPIIKPLEKMAYDTDFVKKEAEEEDLLQPAKKIKKQSPIKYKAIDKILEASPRKGIQDKSLNISSIRFPENDTTNENNPNDFYKSEYNPNKTYHPTFSGNETIYEDDTNDFYDNDLSLSRTLDNESIMETIPENSIAEYLDFFNELPRNFVEGHMRDTSNEYDHTYIHHDLDTGKIKFGDSIVEFKGPDFIVNNNFFKGSPGLYELMFKQNPKNYMTSDFKTFGELVVLTNAHKRNFDPNEQTMGHRGLKYKNIIKPVLEQIKQQDIDKQKEHSRKLRVGKEHTEKIGFGRASPTLVTYNEKPIEYIYWDDVNELVERLKLLVASKHAGNTSNDNEITAIINELKEAGVIY